MITVKINEATEKGKYLLEFLNQFRKDNSKWCQVFPPDTKDKIPNKETLQAIKDANERKNIIRAKDTKELLAKLKE